MWLEYENAYVRPLQVVIGYYSPDCEDGSRWAKKGWYDIAPNSSAVLLWTTNSISTFYAEADDGRTWRGGITINVPFNAFDLCWTTGTNPGLDVGTIRVEATNPGLPWTGTVRLT
jgi:uncharacterized membrane protein